MQKKQLNQIVEYSYNNGRLDESHVEMVASKLTRKELKEYIRALKLEEQKKIVTVISAKELTAEERKKIEALYMNKKTSFYVDSAMIAGVKVIENDQELDINLNNTFRDIMYFLNNE